MNHASINPNNILDDGDEDFPNAQQRPSQSRGNSNLGPTAAAGTAGALGGLFGRKAKNVTSSGTYDPVGVGSKAEKSAWLASQTKGKRKMRWWVGVAIGLVVVLAIVAGIVGGVLGTRNSDSSSGSSSDTNNANSDTAANGDLGKDSVEIKALMNNKNLHKVFPGIDYTPWGTQYPLCFTYPPSQNNVTRDMAVLSQLTNVVRLYGTDCNQTEMVLHAIDRLELSDMKVWMGVWIDTNQTTTNRQVDQMYTILADTKDLSVFKGVIVGNEALYRAGEDKAQSEQELIDILTDVRSQFKTKGYDLPIATSDLGDNWNAQLVQVVDYVMSNIHPFFAGVTANVAAGWTWDFWQTHDVTLTESLPDVKQLISETGWPSDGGEDCGGSTGDCTAGQSGSIASVDGMNTFMNDWVCQALSNGTEYFW
jgi:exo-beta-1,3-glucanase (GH17 family)